MTAPEILALVAHVVELVLVPVVAAVAREHHVAAQLRAARAQLRRDAADGVAAMAGHVEDLKDPAKPGTWDAAAATKAKSDVVKGVQRHAPTALARLAAAMPGCDPEEYVARIVEAEVTRLRRVPRRRRRVPAAT